MKKVLLIIVMLIAIISGNVSAKADYINVRYINKEGQSVKLKTYDGFLKVKLDYKKKTKVNYQYGLTQLVCLWFEITAPKGLYPVSKYKSEKDLLVSSSKPYKFRMKVYDSNGKAVKLWYPKKNKKLYSTTIWEYYYDDFFDEESIKSWTNEVKFLKRPGEKYIVGITAADKKYKTYKKMPKRYRIDNIDKWFAKHKEYTVFTKVT